jgi:CPA1 family monovalent cation:H+ antiporter
MVGAMEDVTAVVTLVIGVIVVSAGARRWHLPAPILLVVAGVLVCFIPGVPVIRLEPELVLVVVLPPLLYATAIRSSLIDIKRNARAIGSLAIGLVLATVVGVGFGLHAVVPGISLATAMALGAVVAPPDAVATTAVARRSGLDRRTLTVLEGESLFNDATSLVALQVALAAIAGEFGPAAAVGEFLVVGLGGLAVGGAVGIALSWIRRRIHDTLTDSAVSLVAPFAAFIPAEELHVSGVVAVVVAGLVLAYRSPADQDPQARLVDGAVWGSVQFVLEGTVFALIGLQLRSIVTETSWDPSELVLASLVVLGAVVLIRPAWVFGTSYLGRIAPWRSAGTPPLNQLAVVSWAGMRGVVSLAAALSLPLAIERRGLLLVLTVVVILGTLVVQGLTLPWVIRRAGIEPPDPRLDTLQRARAQELAGEAALDRLHELAADLHPPQEVVEALERKVELGRFMVWERLADDQATTPTRLYRQLRTEMIRAEREVLLTMRDSGDLDDHLLREVQQLLDLEDALLLQAIDDPDERRGSLDELIPQAPSSCDHLIAAPTAVASANGRACAECVRLGWEWVHLRQCLACGHVGCCDSSRGRHASGHFEAIGHPVMRSVEPGEAWRWCYLDRVLG